jgi:hypothetical protein
MRKKSFVTALIVFLVLVAVVYGLRRQGGGLLSRLSAIHGH